MSKSDNRNIMARSIVGKTRTFPDCGVSRIGLLYLAFVYAAGGVGAGGVGSAGVCVAAAAGGVREFW